MSDNVTDMTVFDSSTRDAICVVASIQFSQEGVVSVQKGSRRTFNKPNCVIAKYHVIGNLHRANRDG